MKTPDKIFVSTDPFGFMSGHYMENHPPHGEEYIRKDALMEWAEEKRDQMKNEAGGCSNMAAAGKYLAYSDLIEKIESL